MSLPSGLVGLFTDAREFLAAIRFAGIDVQEGKLTVLRRGCGVRM